MLIKQFFFTMAYCIISLFGFSQNKNHNSQNVFGLKFHYGSVYIHTPAVKNIAGSRPYGTEIEFSRLPSDTNTYNRCNCLPRNGVALSYFNFDSKILGSGVMLSYFIEPAYRLSNNLKFNIRGAAGLTYVTNPFDTLKNFENRNYTAHLNPYLQIGAGLGYNLSTHFSVTIMGSLQHFSNGGFKEPNRGLNWFTGSVGLLYHSKNNSFIKYTRTSQNFWKQKTSAIDIGIFYLPKQGYNSKVMEQRKFLTGAFVQFTKQYGRISAFTAGTELYYDRLSLGRTNSNGEIGRWIGGIHAGHAFLLGRVIFSQQLGFH